MAADVWGFPKPGSYTRRTLWHSIEGPNQGEKGKLHLALLEKGKSNPIVRNATSISHQKKKNATKVWHRNGKGGKKRACWGGWRKALSFLLPFYFFLAQHDRFSDSGGRRVEERKGGGSGPLFRFCFLFRSSIWTAKVAGVCSKLAVRTTVAQVCSHLIYKKRFLEHVKAKYVLERGLRGKRKEGEEQKLQPAERRGGLGFSFDQMPLTEGRENRNLAFPDIIHNLSRYPPSYRTKCYIINLPGDGFIQFVSAKFCRYVSG